MRFGGNRSGISLLEILVGAALTAGGALAAAKVLEGGVKAASFVESRSELETLRERVRRELDCRETFPHGSAPCAPGSPVAVKAHPARSLTGSPPPEKPDLVRIPAVPAAALASHTRAGEYLLRASCIACNPAAGLCPGPKRLLVEVTRVTADGSRLVADSLTRRTLSAGLPGSSAGLSDGWVDLFGGIPLGCRVP